MKLQFDAIQKEEISLSKNANITDQQYITCICYIYKNQPVQFEQLWTFISSFELTKSQKIDLINKILDSTIVLCKDWIFYTKDNAD